MGPEKAIVERNYSTQRDLCGAKAEERVHSSGLSIAGKLTRFTGRGIYSSWVASRQPTSRRPRVGGHSFGIDQTPSPPPDVFLSRHRFFPPKKGFAAACFIHEATWFSSRSSTDVSSTPRVDLPIPVGVTGGSGLISVPRMNISFT